MKTDSWHSYPKVWAMGHPNVANLFSGDVLIEEKIDGSQFSFGIFDGELKVRSRGAVMAVDFPEKMFAEAVEYVKSIADKLEDGWTYRGEYLRKPKHNTLCYGRIPQNHIMLFDINTGLETYASAVEKAAIAASIGLECVPVLYEGRVESVEQLKGHLDRESVLGGCNVEGVVAKNYAMFGRDGKALMGKYVSEAFKEKHNKEWKASNPGKNDVVQSVIEDFRTEARWRKAVQHLAERGELQNAPQDIGSLMKEIHADFDAECAEEVKDKLYRWAAPKIKRGLCAGFPEWYKSELLKSQFEQEQ